MKDEIALTIKPTLACNMRCLHCFNGDSLFNHEIIDIKIVLNLLKKACKEYKEVKITFHGGEPTLAGIDFYKEFFDYANKMTKKYGTIYHNFFTTNGLLLNDEMIDLLIENKVLINVSYDGPYDNVLRQNCDKVLENIMKIKSKNGRLRCFCTLSKDSYKHLYEIYDWFKKNKIDFKTSPVEKFGYAGENTEILIDTDSLVNVMTKMYRYWIKDKESTIRYFTFEEFASLRKNIQFKHYWFNSKIALNPDGNMYPFGRPNDIHYSLGKPSEVENLEECFEKDSYKKLLEILKEYYNEKCIKCESLDVCNGVAFNMSYMYTDDEEILLNGCVQSNKLFKSILKVNDEIIQDFKNRKSEQYCDTVKEKFKDYLVK